MIKATLAIIVRDQRLLLGQKKKGKVGVGVLCPPGGVFEAGEDPVACLLREVEEEVGLSLS